MKRFIAISFDLILGNFTLILLIEAKKRLITVNDITENILQLKKYDVQEKAANFYLLMVKFHLYF